MSFPVKKMLGRHRRTPTHQGRGEGFVIGDPEGVRIEDLGLFHFQEIPAIGRRCFRVDCHPVGVEDVFRRERADRRAI